MQLAGKVAVVTGAGTGIGRAVAEGLAAAGAAVVLSGRRQAPLDETAADIQTAGGRDPKLGGARGGGAHGAGGVERARRQLGGLDVVVPCHRLLRRGEVMHATAAAVFAEDLRINVTGTFLVCKHAIDPLRRRGGGAIINTASQLALVGSPGYATYCATKGAVLAFTRAIAMDYAGDRIRCNCVCPGLTHTPMAYYDRHDFDPVAAGAAIPLGRVGEPADLAGMYLYLASDAATWITGQSFVVDGGYTAR